MTWKGFDPVPYTRESFLAHVNATDFSAWGGSPYAQGNKVPKFLTLHNTSMPTLKMWVESGPQHDARLQNLESYYAGLGWHAGPHGFISRNFINGFSQLNQPGVHASCFNAVSIGLEMVGEYDSEPFDSGDGAMVRDNAVFAAAALHNKLGWDPAKYVYGVSGLHFHVECKRDNHDCPGKLVKKPDLIGRIVAEMVRQKAAPPANDNGAVPVAQV
jgi:hypothetical protein